MARNLTVQMTAPAQYRNSNLNTEYGNVAIPANGVVNVNTRLLPVLQRLGFTQSAVPNTASIAALSPTVQLTAPAGVGEVHGIGNTSIKVVGGVVTVPRQFVQSLIDEGFTS